MVFVTHSTNAVEVRPDAEEHSQAMFTGRVTENLNRVGSRTRELVLGQTTCPTLNPFGITLCGTSEARPGFRFERPSPGFVQILACLEGEGDVLVDGVWRRCGPGQAYVTPQREPHAYHAVGRKVWKLVWVMFSEDAVSIEGPPMLKAVDAALLESTFLGLYREQNSFGERAVLAAWAHLLDTCARRVLARHIFDPRMNELWELVGGDLARPWTLEEIARVGGLSSEHLRRLCHQTFHRSPMRHLTYLRMRHASELLGLSDAKIEAIARQVGYENSFAFSAAFKREMGISPSACRGPNARAPRPRP